MRRYFVTLLSLFLLNLFTLIIHYHLPQLPSLLDSGYVEVEAFMVEHSPSCSLRYKPLLLLHNHNTVNIIWESTCNGHHIFRYWVDIKNVWEVIVTATEISQGYFVWNIILNGLDTGKNYFYQIEMIQGSNETAVDSPTYDFSLPNTMGIATVCLVSDTQAHVPTIRHLFKLIAQRDPDLVIHGGDVVQSGESLHEWQTSWLSPLELFIKKPSLHNNNNKITQIPIAITRGNHDISFFGNHYGITRRFFAITVANTRWVFIDSHENISEQYEWLMEEVQGQSWNDSKFRIAVTHVPPYVEWWEKEDWEKGDKHWGDLVKNLYLPILLLHNLDLIIGGHSHIYQRGKLNGVHYLIIGGGGGNLEKEQVEHLKIYFVTKIQHHYVNLDILSDGCILVWKVYDLKNEIIDSFSMMSEVC